MGETFENKLEISSHFDYWESGHERTANKATTNLNGLGNKHEYSNC